jgi:uncharacterized membrane protein
LEDLKTQRRILSAIANVSLCTSFVFVSLVGLFACVVFACVVFACVVFAIFSLIVADIFYKGLELVDFYRYAGDGLSDTEAQVGSWRLNQKQ